MLFCRRQPEFPTLWFFALVTLLGSCASYTPVPLPLQPPEQPSLNALVQATNHNLQGTENSPINVKDGLTLSEIAALAVFGNADLKAKRLNLGISRAQAYAAGLLPDPQASFNLDHPNTQGTGLMNAYGTSLSYDLTPLITRNARVDSAKGTQEKVRLEILWQEWQVIQQAQMLAIRYQFELDRLDLFEEMKQLYQKRYQHSVRGLNEGNVTLKDNGSDLTTLLDFYSQFNQLEQLHSQTRHSLCLLLGLKPSSILPVIHLPTPVELTPLVIQKQLEKLSDIRPDLAALKAGYQAQEAQVRAAILGQFPSLSIGLNRARDTGGIATNGFSIGLSLPFFSRNQGGIAIERATRAQLYQEYQNRVIQAENEVDQLLSLQSIVEEQQTTLDTYLPLLKSLLLRSRGAYQQGDLDSLSFLNMESTWLNKKLEQINLQQAHWENRIALQALLVIPQANQYPSNTNSQELQP